ncbi:hypothetical protein FSP39_015855 [Pinctada imbricata]|uniref:hydroxymethylbilane synthase n=1 Tax=Pinctada imbricata TaxID=66713 RepID=A0AA88Y7Q6_PINIB|nr:hypothetical protein FSP39_015855 [Pinctada imbricata]
MRGRKRAGGRRLEGAGAGGQGKDRLAMVQTDIILNALQRKCPDVEYEIITMSKIIDKLQDVPVKVGETTVFIKKLEIALLQNEVDIVIHSLKDLPAKLPDGLVVACVYERDSPYDAVAMNRENKDLVLKDLPAGSVIGTSSLRRVAQISRKYPHLKFENIRGNLNTRFEKLDGDGIYAAIILAESGLLRMNMENRITERLAGDVCMHAVCQGALAVECREDDENIIKLLSVIHDRNTTLQCIAERSFIKQLDCGYKVPVSVLTTVKDEKVIRLVLVYNMSFMPIQITLHGEVSSTDGKNFIKKSITKSFVEDETSELNPQKLSYNDPRKEYLGISPPPQVSHKSLLAAENAGIQLASNIINDTDGDEILRTAKNETEAYVRSEKLKKYQLSTKSP